jgi:hypothetical protein
VHLKIKKIDEDPKLADIVYRIQTVIKLLLSSTSIYKLFVTADAKLFNQAVPVGSAPRIPKVPPDQVNVAEIGIKCSKCGKEHKLYAKFIDNPAIDNDFQKKRMKPFPKDNKLKCDCGYEIDLSGVRNNLELQARKKLVF